jgi:hypothetical protein
MRCEAGATSFNSRAAWTLGSVGRAPVHTRVEGPRLPAVWSIPHRDGAATSSRPNTASVRCGHPRCTISQRSASALTCRVCWAATAWHTLRAQKLDQGLRRSRVLDIPGRWRAVARSSSRLKRSCRQRLFGSTDHKWKVRLLLVFVSMHFTRHDNMHGS